MTDITTQLLDQIDAKQSELELMLETVRRMYASVQGTSDVLANIEAVSQAFTQASNSLFEVKIALIHSGFLPDPSMADEEE